ncbi:hypothetical protein, partial [Tabrizicola sp.]|uniref:hypothetical protein n=1 Tax=Tabrizicola sp. TaxID=2005166 RepID=UPI002FDD845A
HRPMRFLPTMTRSLAIGPFPSRSVGTVGADMPVVNRICNTKMSHYGADFELLLRQAVALRNFRISAGETGHSGP